MFYIGPYLIFKLKFEYIYLDTKLSDWQSFKMKCFPLEIAALGSLAFHYMIQLIVNKLKCSLV